MNAPPVIASEAKQSSGASADGVEREIEVTAFPLFAHADEFVGVVVIFWRV